MGIIASPFHWYCYILSDLASCTQTHFSMHGIAHTAARMGLLLTSCLSTLKFNLMEVIQENLDSNSHLWMKVLCGGISWVLMTIRVILRRINQTKNPKMPRSIQGRIMRQKATRSGIRISLKPKPMVYINRLGNLLSLGQFETSAEVQTEHLTWGSIHVFSQTSVCLDFDLNNRK